MDAINGLTINDVVKRTSKFVAATDYIESFPRVPMMRLLAERSYICDYINKKMLPDRIKNPKPSFFCFLKKVPKTQEELVKQLKAYEREFDYSRSEVSAFIEKIECCDIRILRDFAKSLESYNILYAYYYMQQDV